MKTKRHEFILWIEGIGFGIIILLSWVTEILRVPHFFFSEPMDFNWARVMLRTAVVLCVWAAVHIATRRLLKRLRHLEEYLLLCAWCRKIGHEGDWKTTEEYFGVLSTHTTHGICPECSRKMRESVASATSVTR